MSDPSQPTPDARLLDLEALTQLTAGVAHDLGNLLTVVIGHCELALADSADVGEVVDDLRAILAGATQAGALVERLALATRRVRVPRPQVFDLARLVHAAAGVLGELVRPHHVLTVETPGDEALPVRGDAEEVEAVLAQVVASVAGDGLGKGTALVLRAARHDIAAEAEPPLTPGPHAAVELHGGDAAPSSGRRHAADLAVPRLRAVRAGGALVEGGRPGEPIATLLLPLVPAATR